MYRDQFGEFVCGYRLYLKGVLHLKYIPFLLGFQPS